MEVISSKLLNDLFNHSSRWLSNLKRAKKARKTASIKALRQVILASRETAVYVRQLNETGHCDHASEKHLALLWTELGFELEDLKLNKLAKRCQIKGKHWSDPKHFDSDFLEKADVSLERMERLAKEVIANLDA